MQVAGGKTCSSGADSWGRRRVHYTVHHTMHHSLHYAPVVHGVVQRKSPDPNSPGHTHHTVAAGSTLSRRAGEALLIFSTGAAQLVGLLLRHKEPVGFRLAQRF